MAGDPTADPACDSTELLRRRLTAFYREGQPWQEEPTLATFAANLGRADKDLASVLASLIGSLGPEMQLRHLRLNHLLELRQDGARR